MCHLHPDPNFRSCKVPQERIPDDNQYTECHGYVDRPEKMGGAKNMECFGDLAARHLGSELCRHRVLAWLANLKHKELLEGVKVGLRQVKTWLFFLARLFSSPGWCCGPPRLYLCSLL